MTLKSELDVFGQLFKQRLNETMKASLRWVTASQVDWEAQTMTATDSDELEYFDVLLGVGTTAIKPVLNTDCLIVIVEGDEATAFLLYADEAELIQYNGGQNGGLTITPELVTQLGKNNQYVETLKTATKAIATALDALVPGTSAAFDASMGTVELGDYSTIEDTKITH